MKYAKNRGQKIAYDITGKGPAILFQHGFLSNRQSWHELAFVDALKDEYTVICVDSLGHGDSDKPDDAELYVRQQRAADIVAVLDAEGIEKAHYVGYSMGGWLGVGCLAHHGGRLASLTIGGFDPFTEAEILADISFSDFLAMAKQAAPELVEWVTAEVGPGLAGCLKALAVYELPESTVTQNSLPIHFWCGSEDECFETMKALHRRTPGATFSEVPGDHIGAMVFSAGESIEAIKGFIDRLC